MNMGTPNYRSSGTPATQLGVSTPGELKNAWPQLESNLWQKFATPMLYT